MCYRWIPLAILVPLSFTLAQCSEPTRPDTGAPRLPTELTAAERELAASTNEFGFELFQRIVATVPADSNVFTSPLSVAYALALAYNGAAGDTRDGIATTLALGQQTADQVNESFAGLTDVLTGADSSVIMAIANAAWYSTHWTLVPEFRDICQEFFDAEVAALDFNQASAADTVNRWVEANTRGKIKKLVDPPLPADLVYILANAVYFKADWTYPFDPEETRTDDFHTADGRIVSADFMSLDSWDYQDEEGQPDPDLAFLIKNGEFAAFSLPYGDRWFRMTIFLPDESVPVEEFISRLTVEQWGAWRSEFQTGRFYARFPKFKFSFATGLKGALSAMGMDLAFRPGEADFSNMIEGGGVWIDSVIHMTFVQVDEKGTEAAAVTGVIGIISMPPFINCDRPFAFIIWEKESGAVIFAGKVARPVWQE